MHWHKDQAASTLHNAPYTRQIKETTKAKISWWCIIWTDMVLTDWNIPAQTHKSNPQRSNPQPQILLLAQPSCICWRIRKFLAQYPFSFELIVLKFGTGDQDSSYSTSNGWSEFRTHQHTSWLTGVSENHNGANNIVCHLDYDLVDNIGIP